MVELANDRWFPLVNLGLATSAAMLWYVTAGRVGWPLLVVLLVPWILRIAARRAPFRRSRFDGWLFIFGITAVIGTFTAYSSTQAQGKFWVIVGAMGVYFAIVSVSRRDAWLLAGATGPVGALLALYFVMSNNWLQWPADIGILNRIGMLWMQIRPSFPFPVLHPNTLGGMMALVLPFTLAFGIYAWQKKQVRWMQLAAASVIITAGGLLFTSSLGAWLALAVGLSCWVLWPVSGILYKKLPLPRKVIYGAILLLLGLVGLLFLYFLLGTGSGQEDSATRLGLAQQTLYLIEDFALTGSGLATFPALYAQYVRVTPSFFAAYSNFYFDLWLEQGIFALLTMLVLIGTSFWLLFQRALDKAEPERLPAAETDGVEMRRRRKKRQKMLPQEMVLFRWAAFVSLVVMVLHGLIDNALYGAQASPLLFFAPAMAILVTRRRKSADLAPAAVQRRRWAMGVGVTAVLLVGLFFGFRQRVEAQWYANRGALALARAELVGWPTNQWDSGGDLGRFDQATALLERSLALDPNNRTANHRLGLIAMVGREYETAVAFLETAVMETPEHRGIVKSVGYSHVWLGDFDQALVYLRDISESQAEMTIYSNWWNRQNRPDLASKASEMVAILENVTLFNP